MEQSELLLQVRRVDHLGLVSGVARKIRLVEIIDGMIPPAPPPPPKGVTAGEVILALLLNGLGFVSRPLYLTPAYFETKPVGTLIRPGMTEEDLNEFNLGRALGETCTRRDSPRSSCTWPVSPWACRNEGRPSSTSIRPPLRSPDGIRRAKRGRRPWRTTMGRRRSFGSPMDTLKT